jgi:hypothetical protein
MNQDRKDLAKQLATYADAITAFSFVQSVAFAFSLTQHEVRDSVLKAASIAEMITFAAYIVYLLFVGICWIGNRTLLDDSEADQQTRSWATALWVGRIIVILLGAFLCLLAIHLTVKGSTHQTFPT